MSTTQRDIYTSHAAFPILASTLLPLEEEEEQLHHQSPRRSDPNSSKSTWDLEPSVNDYFHLSKYRNDGRHLLRCGITIGLSYLKEWRNIEQNRNLLSDVARRLLILFLAGLAHDVKGSEIGDEPSEPQQERGEENDEIHTRVYIVHPIHSTTFAPEVLFNSLLEFRKNPDDNETEASLISQTQAISLLDRVELLPVPDFASATQAISQISEALSRIHDQFRHDQEREFMDDDDSEKGASSYHEDSRHSGPPTTLVIVEGLDTMAEDIIHNTNALRGSAVLIPALRALTHLSRAHASFLSVLLVNTTALGPSMPSSTQQSRFADATSTISPQSPLAEGQMTSPAIGGLYSIFSREYATSNYHAYQGGHGDGQQAQSLPLLNTLLSRTLDQGIDTHLLLQTRRNQALVEVIKDRAGDGLGKWCIWK